VLNGRVFTSSSASTPLSSLAIAKIKDTINLFHSMDYTQGKMGRVFVARIDHKEDLLSELQDLAVNEDIKSAFFSLLGATGGAKMVTGPKQKSLPPDVNIRQFDDAKEVLGIGNIFWEDGKPKIHLHASVSSSNETLMGCFREFTEVFMVIEVMIFEIEGIMAERIHDPDIGFSPVRFFQ
jgi:predicted DNA-binding protein with PD1-like motif